MSDDIDNLVSRVQFTGPAYKTFRKTNGVQAAGAPSEPPQNSEVATQHTLSMERYAAPKATPIHRDYREGRTHRFGVLRSLLTEAGSRATAAAAPKTLIPVVRVIGATGGAGVTTVLSTVARALSESAEICAIVDADPESLLPCHFGIIERRDAGGIHAAMIPGAHPVFLLKKSVATATSTDGSRRDWLEDGLLPLGSSLDRILIDGTFRFWDASHPVDFGQVTNLVVLTPDLNSVYRIDAILRSLAGQAAFFVLNKFDETVGLHEQVLGWLKRKLGDRLLPVTLRRSDEVADALAEGITVMDYSPASGIAEDYRGLVEIIRRWSGVALPVSALAKKELSA